ncbi:hypothetical protein [Deinococcus pimensis]|uniref:hypothetical protein n=1 Tax=Deinococcus pimensis TaxID=309888 RepID=UPI00048165A8|nr:hypothetical protein [Deinococcus pimensis]
MRTNHLKPMASLLAASILQACGNAPAPSGGHDLVTLTLRAPLRDVTGAGVTPQAVPTAPEGSSAVQLVRVRVFTSDGTPVKFDARHQADPSGTLDTIDLTPSASSVSVSLVPGEYVFQSAGRGGTPDSALLAFGRQEHQNVVANGVVTLKLTTLLDPAALTLTTALPMNAARPGQTFDTRLTVRTLRSGDARYDVPLSDFSAAYQPTGGVIAGSSNLGARVHVDDAPTATAFKLDADVNGLVAGGSDVAQPGAGAAHLTLPFVAAGSMNVDLTAPALTAAASSDGVTGTAGDDVGLARLDVYDGPVIVASTAEGAPAKVTFDVDASGHVTPTWRAPLTLDAGAHALTVVATDSSGNETRQALDVTGAGAPVTVTSTPDWGAATADTISARNGGTLSTTGADGTTYTLTFPPDALVDDTQITMTPLADVTGLPFSGGLAGAVKLEPDGLRLQRPARLTITPARAVSAARLSVFSYEGAGDHVGVPLLDPSTTTSSVTLNLLHFSGYGVSDGSSAERDALAAQAVKYGAEAYGMELAALLNAQRVAELQGLPGDPNFAWRLHDILDRAYQDTVAPYLGQLASSCGALDTLFPAMLSWTRTATLLYGGDGDAFLPQQTAITDAAVSSVGVCLREETQPCVASDAASLKHLLLTARRAELLGVPGNVLTASTCGWSGRLGRTVLQHVALTPQWNVTETRDRKVTLDIRLSPPSVAEAIDSLRGVTSHRNETTSTYDASYVLVVTGGGPDEISENGKVVCSGGYSRLHTDGSEEHGDTHDGAGGAVTFGDGRWVINYGGPTIFTTSQRVITDVDSYDCSTYLNQNTVTTYPPQQQGEGLGLYVEVSGDALASALHGSIKGPEDGGGTSDVITYDLTRTSRSAP